MNSLSVNEIFSFKLCTIEEHSLITIIASPYFDSISLNCQYLNISETKFLLYTNRNTQTIPINPIRNELKTSMLKKFLPISKMPKTVPKLPNRYLNKNPFRVSFQELLTIFKKSSAPNFN